MMKPFLFAPLALFTALTIPVRAADTDVPPQVAERLRQLEERLSEVKTLRVNFVQEKKMSILERKLVLTGRISLQQPDKIAWRVHSPIRYGMVIQGATLSQWSEETAAVQQLSLGGNPVFTTAVQQIRSWFGGNYLALAQEFKISLLSESPLAFQFTPRAHSPAREIVARIIMRFGSDERFLKSLEVVETGGDTMKIQFSETTLNPVLEKAEWDPKRE